MKGSNYLDWSRCVYRLAFFLYGNFQYLHNMLMFYTDVYSQIYRVLKPGQVFACYEWCLTPKYDKNDANHRLIKKKIEEGNPIYPPSF